MIQSRAAVSALAIAALMAGCSRQAEAPAQAAPPQAAAPAAPPATPVGDACESGRTVTVQYPDTGTAQVAYLNQTYVLRTAPAASGARYAGSGMEWTTASQAGQETAVLSRLGPNQDVGVAVLERCGRPTSVGATLPSQPLPAPTPGGVIPAVAPCRSQQLKLSADGGDAGMGHRVAILGVQNTGTQACSLTGYPGVTLLDPQGRSLTAIRTEQNASSYLSSGPGPSPVTVAPQAKAYFDIAWTVVPNEGAGERVCPTAATIRFTAPGDAAAVTFAQSFTPCGGKIQVRPLRQTAEDTTPTTT
ncbi:hypothetical protein BH09PSE1_BH09PSE1_16310 [soil metagenome]